MFESIKHWFQSVETDNRLFNHADDESVHLALASVLHHIINIEHHESRRERREFRDILKSEFGVSDAQADYLHEAVESANSDFEQDLTTINEHLKSNPVMRMHFMEKLIKLISIDGVLDDEMDDFYRALHVIFPDIRVN